MKKAQDRHLDLYSDYLISSSRLVTATGFSALCEGAVSHDQITKSLIGAAKTSMDLWKMVKSTLRKIETKKGIILFDDSIEHKPYTDESDIVNWHYDHTSGKSVKGIQFLTPLYYEPDSEFSIPVGFEFVKKEVKYSDLKTRKEMRKSSKTKNEIYRELLQTCVQNNIQFSYVLNDIWFGSADNMNFVKLTLKKDFVMPLKSNRKLSFTKPVGKKHPYLSIESVDFKENKPQEIYLEGVDFPLLLVKQVFKNKDDSEGILYLVTSDLSLDYDAITILYQKRWKIEEYHKSMKQNASLEKSPTQTFNSQTNHFFAALWAYFKLELMKVKTKLNHFALKSKIYMAGLRAAHKHLKTFSLA